MFSMQSPLLNDPRSIILYGGSFNPLHMSHVLVHAALCAYFPLARKWIVPAYSHAFDKRLMPFERRLNVLKAVFGHAPNTCVSDIEAQIGKTPTCTVDVARELIRRFPDCRLWIIGGSDLIEDPPKWREIDALKKMARFVFYPRAGYPADASQASQPGDSDAPMLLDILPLPALSSSEIRECLAKKDRKRVQSLLPAAAFDDLVLHGMI